MRQLPVMLFSVDAPGMLALESLHNYEKLKAIVILFFFNCQQTFRSFASSLPCLKLAYAPENRPSQKEISSTSKRWFSGAMLVTAIGRVSGVASFEKTQSWGLRSAETLWSEVLGDEVSWSLEGQTTKMTQRYCCWATNDCVSWYVYLEYIYIYTYVNILYYIYTNT